MAIMDIASAVSNVKTMLAGLSAWQTITGTANATDAAAYIIKGGYENWDSGSRVAPFCILDIQEFSGRFNGGRFHQTLPIDLIFELEVPEANRTTYETQYVWVWEKLSALLAGIAGAVQGGGQLMSIDLDLLLKPGQIDAKENNGRCDWLFILQLGVVLK